jgi:hypothetical protein
MATNDSTCHTNYQYYYDIPWMVISYEIAFLLLFPLIGVYCCVREQGEALERGFMIYCQNTFCLIDTRVPDGAVFVTMVAKLHGGQTHLWTILVTLHRILYDVA